jgi:hypothetical protein
MIIKDDVEVKYQSTKTIKKTSGTTRSRTQLLFVRKPMNKVPPRNSGGAQLLAAVLLSAQCSNAQGISTPLFHGSLAPKLFSDPELWSMRKFLLDSNNITWSHTLLIQKFDKESFVREMFSKLASTRYNSRSLTTLICNPPSRRFAETEIADFVATHCKSLQRVEAKMSHAFFGADEDTMRFVPSLAEASASTLTQLRIRNCGNIDALRHLVNLVELNILGETVESKLVNRTNCFLCPLRRLRKLCLEEVDFRVDDDTKVADRCLFEQAFATSGLASTLTHLQIISCAGFDNVSAIRHLVCLTYLELESMHGIETCYCCGFETWGEFPHLEELRLSYLSPTYSSDLAERSAAILFPVLRELRLERVTNAENLFLNSDQRLPMLRTLKLNKCCFQEVFSLRNLEYLELDDFFDDDESATMYCIPAVFNSWDTLQSLKVQNVTMIRNFDFLVPPENNDNNNIKSKLSHLAFSSSNLTSGGLTDASALRHFRQQVAGDFFEGLLSTKSHRDRPCEETCEQVDFPHVKLLSLAVDNLTVSRLHKIAQLFPNVEIIELLSIWLSGHHDDDEDGLLLNSDLKEILTRMQFLKEFTLNNVRKWFRD